MRRKMEKYKDGEKHRFTGAVERFGSFIDKESGKLKKSVLLMDIRDEKGNLCTQHAWVTVDKRLEQAGLLEGVKYSFQAKVGTYKRGRESYDFQLKRLSEVALAA